jgi:hypothetical protein
MPDSPIQQRHLTWQRVLHTASECLDSMLKNSCNSFHRTIQPQSSHMALYNLSSYLFIQKVIEYQSHYKVFRFVVGTKPCVQHMLQIYRRRVRGMVQVVDKDVMSELLMFFSQFSALSFLSQFGVSNILGLF